MVKKRFPLRAAGAGQVRFAYGPDRSRAVQRTVSTNVVVIAKVEGMMPLISADREEFCREKSGDVRRFARWGVCAMGVLGALMLAGCATGDAESDAFFNRGWIWPRSLDEPTPAPEHSATAWDQTPVR